MYDGPDVFGSIIGLFYIVFHRLLNGSLMDFILFCGLVYVFIKNRSLEKEIREININIDKINKTVSKIVNDINEYDVHLLNVIDKKISTTKHKQDCNIEIEKKRTSSNELEIMRRYNM